jgi:heme/copper-type cytochrome/quinol oxidase subunit 1
MVYFLAALAVGILLQTPPALAGHPVLAVLRPTHLHLLVVGWVTQVIFGVAYWMFPRFSAERPRGHESLGWAAFVLLNAGLLCRVVGEPLSALGHRTGGWLVASAVLQLVAGWAFVLNTWPRIRER